MPGLCLPSNQTANLAVYTSLKTAYEQRLHYFNQIKLEDNTITYNLDNVKKALVNDIRATIGQETLIDHVPSDPKFKTSQITQIVISSSWIVSLNQEMLTKLFNDAFVSLDTSVFNVRLAQGRWIYRRSVQNCN